MKSFLVFIIFSTLTFPLLADWEQVNLSIQDEFTDIAFKNSVGLVTGKKGVYYSTNGGITSNSWTRASSYFNQSDSVHYNRAQFFGCVEAPNNNEIYFCGVDTVSNVALIYTFNTTTFVLKSNYIGSSGSKLNKIAMRSNNRFYAVGDNGLIVTFNYSSITNVQTITTNFTHNLNSVDLLSGTKIMCAADEYLIHGTISNNSLVIEFQEYYHANKNFKDYIYQNSSNLSIGAGYYKDQNGINFTESHFYYQDSLNGNRLKNLLGQYYIGTSNGIFKKLNNTDAIELQPSSLGFNILSLNYGSGRIFACGKNGTILYTDDSGGSPIPFAQITSQGGCVSNNTYITSVMGTVNNCSWYIDNVYTNSSLSNFYHTFTTIGNHTIKLIFQNNNYSDTVESTIQVVSIPEINKPVFLLDSILCKSEVLNISIDSSENNVYYSLIKFGSSLIYGVSGSGNTGTISFETQAISQAGLFYIRASSTLANCVNNFTDTIQVYLEHTKANFHSSLINAELGENVSFFEQCKDASNFRWEFTNQPAQLISFNPNPSNSFSLLGQDSIKLVAWSVNDCYDSITLKSPFIYAPPTEIDSCWGMILNDSDGQWQGYEQPNITRMTRSKTGYFITGVCDTLILKSRVGDSLNLNVKGTYLAKYTDQGILKWVINSKINPIPNYQLEYHYPTALIEDTNENVFLTGISDNSYFLDNQGDTIEKGLTNYIMKFDKFGKRIWDRYTNVLLNNIALDNDQNIFLTTNWGTPYSDGTISDLRLKQNNVLMNTVTNTDIICTSCRQYSILKLNQNADVINNFMIEISHTNNIVSPKLTFDAQNNMYIFGSKEIGGYLHEPASTDTYSLPSTPGNYGGKMYLAKYNTLGELQWLVNSHTENALNDRTEAYNAVTDQAGNTYLTGSNDFNNYFPYYPQVIENADGTIKTFQGGQYFIAKINSSGICEWIQGNNSSYYGFGRGIIIDGNELKVIVEVKNNSGTTVQCNFTSQDGSFLNYSNSIIHYLIASYDFNGNLLGITKSGISSNNNNISDEFSWGFTKLNDGYFLISRNLSAPYLNPPLEDFSLVIQALYGDASVNKLSLNCGYRQNPVFHTVNSVSICRGNDYIDNFGNLTQNVQVPFTILDSLLSINGVDSIVITHVNLYPDNFYSSTSVCYGADYSLSDTTFYSIQSPITYNYSAISPNGCLANYTMLITPQVIINNSIIESVCYGADYSLPDTTFYSIQSPITYNYSAISPNGCFANYTMLITPQAMINNNIIENEDSLSSTFYNNANYQWLNCDDNYAIIPQENSFFIDSLSTGHFSVAITIGTCSDTSECIFVSTASISKNNLNNISINPNPATDNITIDLGEISESGIVKIYQLSGQLIMEENFEATQFVNLNVSNFSKGLYLIEINVLSAKKIFKVVKD